VYDQSAYYYGDPYAAAGYGMMDHYPYGAGYEYMYSPFYMQQQDYSQYPPYHPSMHHASPHMYVPHNLPVSYTQYAQHPQHLQHPQYPHHPQHAQHSQQAHRASAPQPQSRLQPQRMSDPPAAPHVGPAMVAQTSQPLPLASPQPPSPASAGAGSASGGGPVPSQQP
jgi:hypothetical protein